MKLGGIIPAIVVVLYLLTALSGALLFIHKGEV